MRNTTPITVTLPHDMATMVKQRVASGEYASDSEVIRDGLRALKARDEALEKWLQKEAAESFREYDADPSTGIPAEDVMDQIRAAYHAKTKNSDAA
ncbi:MAG: type II toxin-antitoxin system ParD family antitoxin [Rhizomicrobium sp.]